VDVAIFQQVLADLLPGTGLNKYIVRERLPDGHQSSAARYVLQEVELLVASRSPEVLANDALIVLFRLAFVVYEP